MAVLRLKKKHHERVRRQTLSVSGTLDCQPFKSIFNSGCTVFLSALSVVVATILSRDNVNVVSVVDCKYIAEIIESESTVHRRVFILALGRFFNGQQGVQ